MTKASTPTPAPIVIPTAIATEGGPTAVRTSLDAPAEVQQTGVAGDAPKGTCTVAPGRTVDGKGPGETVELDEGDAARMVKLGFILDRDGTVVVQTEGPKVVSGAEIVER